jgi:hypothetical protein
MPKPDRSFLILCHPPFWQGEALLGQPTRSNLVLKSSITIVLEAGGKVKNLFPPRRATRLNCHWFFPFPSRYILCGLPIASSVITTYAVLGPTAVGVNLTGIRQLLPAASEDLQLVV